MESLKSKKNGIDSPLAKRKAFLTAFPSGEVTGLG